MTKLVNYNEKRARPLRVHCVRAGAVVYTTDASVSPCVCEAIVKFQTVLFRVHIVLQAIGELEPNFCSAISSFSLWLSSSCDERVVIRYIIYGICTLLHCGLIDCGMMNYRTVAQHQLLYACGFQF